ncbi:MAG TPA: phage protease, partial [Candidatus Acidoferrum sp.]|nr:phage protease [Candidatus Acidoferrum sp.]
GHEMLIDHEHFKHDAGKETIAYGWLQQLEHRDDGIFGRIRWSATGQKAVDGGDYRFFSTEYDPADLEILNDRRVRPLRLAGLTLTNDPNNKGARPITNRQGAGAHGPSGVVAPAPFSPNTAESSAGRNADQAAATRSQHETFDRVIQDSPGGRDAVTAVTTKQKENQRKILMKNIATKLGLAAEASEDAILAEVTKLLNRNQELEPLIEENRTLKNRQTAIDADSVDTLLAAHGVKEERVLNRLKPVLLGLAHADRQGFLDECVPKPAAAAAIASAASHQTKLFNRDTKTPIGGKVVEADAGKADQLKATKIMNRAREIKKEAPNVSEATAVIMAQRELEAVI